MYLNLFSLCDRVLLSKDIVFSPLVFALFFILLFSFDVQVRIEVQITAGFPIKQVIVQEVAACKASWVILERYLISLMYIT